MGSIFLSVESTYQYLYDIGGLKWACYTYPIDFSIPFNISAVVLCNMLIEYPITLVCIYTSLSFNLMYASQ